ncbi:hypothetical protein [Cerasicoccus arenae]|uniref:GYF domain-containing protein n=1 Tax=Cerasicoccus arenae TaxID=424488 RepID=A0A8J3DDR8_9BACT|nr:hypothetical protein [Cerasicoccus arenae]MBK1858915.1 hypothetical protein [Cerasicoccus arenae]GHC08165.1 hypothetical protein GCM10007047_26750 [Cerasicoccus arenae]
MGEYYIQEPGSEEAKGPYDVGRIADLIEAGKASETTLYYDEDREDWLPLMECEEIRLAVNPVQKPLSLRPKDISEDSLNHDDEHLPELKVDQMLAAAEGNTDETRHLKKKHRAAETAAAISLPALAVIMLMAAIVDIWPNVAVISTIQEDGDYGLLISHPLLVVGVADLFLTLCCILSVTDAFPLIRFRMMLGFGYFTYIFWSWGDQTMMIAVAVSSFAAWFCTITLNLYAMIACAVLGIVGMGAVAVMTVLG